MIFHVVKQGDTVYKISLLYGVSMEEIIKDNGLTTPDELIIGQVLVIVKNREKIKRYITTAGYSYPNINRDVFSVALNYLTYLNCFNYSINEDGTLSELSDEFLIQSANNFNTMSLMVITNLDINGGFNSEKLSTILNDEELQDVLIYNILKVAKEKCYFGVDSDMEYIFGKDKIEYENFLKKLATVLHSEGLILTAAVAPKTSDNQKGILYESHEYEMIGDIVDKVFIMTYEWGYIAGPPMAVAPIYEVDKVIEYAVTQIESKKILMGIPNYGYDWVIPFKSGTRAKVISNVEAINIAKKYGAEIEYSQKSQAPFFRYYDENSIQHEVWFEDARSIYAKLSLVDKYDLGGIFYWTIMKPFPQNWTVLENTFNIIKKPTFTY